ncbi:PepSY-associated TM helix domain-containing protein [Hyphococcus lacteus]|uniref:PepSY-associated TM helix domain-containing protein n=1 Tax=Hyphococcus lacteus TaxID=3143536 RepID=A0ABV3Z8L6_9PROT
MSKRLLALHRWMSLIFAVFWLAQVLTGMFITFHWEARDLAIAGAHQRTDLVAIGRQISSLEEGKDVRVKSVWTTAGRADRYYLNLSTGEKVRILGDGSIIEYSLADSSRFFNTLVRIHHNLLVGDVGKTIIGISGILLFFNLIIAFNIAWSRRGMLKRQPWPSKRLPSRGRLFHFHLLFGAVAVIPALILVGSGVLLRYESSVAGVLGAELPKISQVADSGTGHVTFSEAASTAMAAIPGSKLTSVNMPTEENAFYQFRLLEPGELRRAYGKSYVTVNAKNGNIISIFPASEAPFAISFVNALYAIHVGEAGGLLGRIFITVLGLWLLILIVLGLKLWWIRTAAKVETHRN